MALSKARKSVCLFRGEEERVLTQDNTIETSLARLEDSLNYRFRNRELLRSAITHRSYIPESGQPVEDNERLEFLGDAVLELIISDLLYKRYASKYKEGDLTKMRAYLVSETRLVMLAEKLDLGSHLLLGKGEEKCGGRARPSIVADAFEAIVGAIYLDGGFDEAYGFIVRQFEDLLESAPRKGLKIDYKSRLQEMTQKRFHALPSYKLIDVEGPDHAKRFEVALFFEGREISRGTGKSKKEAEQRAARLALKNFEENLGKNGFG
ncbi:MAG: ribonuclease III [Thermodesulfobacteria bacterium]|nr:ribonuclease III [Thermodesulfobacteriota bacterium]